MRQERTSKAVVVAGKVIIVFFIVQLFQGHYVSPHFWFCTATYDFCPWRWYECFFSNGQTQPTVGQKRFASDLGKTSLQTNPAKNPASKYCRTTPPKGLFPGGFCKILCRIFFCHARFLGSLLGSFQKFCIEILHKILQKTIEKMGLLFKQECLKLERFLE